MSRSPLQLLAIIHNRLVPEWLMRFRRNRIFRFPAVAAPPKIPDGLRIAWAQTETELETAAIAAKNPLEPDDRTGHRAAVAYRNGEPVAAVWVAPDHFFERELGLRYDLPPGGFWIYCAHVAKRHRNQGIYRALLGFVLAELAAAGGTAAFDAFAAVNPINRDSMRSHQYYGTPVGTVTAGRVFAVACGHATGNLTIDRRWSWNCYHRPVVVAIRQEVEADGVQRDERRTPTTPVPRERA